MSSRSGKGGLRKSHSVEQQRQRVEHKLEEILDLQSSIKQALHDISSKVDCIAMQAQHAANRLLWQTDSAKVMRNLNPVTLDLETYLNELIVIQYQLQPEESGETECSETDLSPARPSRLASEAGRLCQTSSQQSPFDKLSQSMQQSQEKDGPLPNVHADEAHNQLGQIADNQNYAIDLKNEIKSELPEKLSDFPEIEVHQSGKIGEIMNEIFGEIQESEMSERKDENMSGDNFDYHQVDRQNLELEIQVPNCKTRDCEKRTASQGQNEETPGKLSEILAKHSLDGSHNSTDNISVLSAKPKKRTKKAKKMLELLKGVAPLLDQPTLDAELKIHMDYGMGPSILALTLEKMEVSDLTITEVIDPSFFWIQINNQDLEDLSDELLLYNSRLSKTDWWYSLKCEPCAKMVVCACFTQDNVWYRARILSVYRNSDSEQFTVEVFYLDYGNREYITLERIRPLHPKFSRQPCHAFACALSEVGPPVSNTWSPDTSADFAKFVAKQTRFFVRLTTVASCPLHLAELYFSHDKQMLGTPPVKKSVTSVMQSLNELMINEERGKKVSNEEIINVYNERMSALSKLDQTPNLISLFSEMELHQCQSPKLSQCHPKCSDSNENEAKTVAQDPCQPNQHDSKQSRKNSEDWITQLVDDSFDQLLDAEMYGAKLNVEILKTDDKQDSSIDLTRETSSVRNDKSSSTSLTSDQRSSEVSASQWLKNCGLPNRVPKHCEYSQIYNELMDGGTRHLESATGNYEVVDAIPHCDTIDEIPKEYKKQEIMVPEDSCLTFLMAFIKTPHQFWIHIVSKEAQESLDNLNRELNEYYSKENKVMLKCLEGKGLQLNTVCCAQYSADNSFYRAVVTDLHQSGGSSGDVQLQEVKVFYVDFGDEEWVNVDRLYPLPPKFVEIPPQAVCCSLYGVEPILPENEEDSGKKLKWSSSATEAFTSLTSFDNQLVGYLTSYTPGDLICPGSDNPMLMVIANTSRDADVIVSEELVRKGHAKATELPKIPNISYNVPDQKESQEEISAMAAFNPATEDFLSERNSYQIDIDDPAVAAYGYKPTDERRVCYYFNKNGYCVRGDNCRFEHVRNRGAITTDKKPVFCAYDASHTITLPKQGSWITLEVTNIIDAAHFYATFPFGTRPVLDIIQDEQKVKHDDCDDTNDSVLNSFKKLESRMNEEYSRITHRDTDYSVYAVGEVVACRFSQDNCWYRARVLNSNPEDHQVLVFYVDYGNREWIGESHIRQMKPEFMHLPFQSIECFLPLQPITKEWTKQSTSFFRNLVDGKLLFAKVLHSGFNNVLTLELYDTSETDDIYINQHIVDHGYAVKSDLVAFKSEHSCTSNSHGDRGSAISSPSSQSPPIRMLPG